MKLFKLLSGKKALETWQLVLLILALLLFFFVLAWYSGLNAELGSLLDKWGELF